jgi:hypothetical protein
MVIPGKDPMDYTQLERFEYELCEKFKLNEYGVYKSIHAIVLNDTGLSSLKKTAFKMPGYKKIIGVNLDEHQIDNEVINKNF